VAARPYARLEDLLRVSGIGERTLERLRGLVTL
jgi:DNA uptake protein ComE-like DNA-binding protein